MPEEKKEKGPSKEYWRALDRRVPRAADQGEEIEEGELLRGEVGPNIAPMEEEIGGEEGGDEEEGWVVGPNILPMERGGEEERMKRKQSHRDSTPDSAPDGQISSGI